MFDQNQLNSTFYTNASNLYTIERSHTSFSLNEYIFGRFCSEFKDFTQQFQSTSLNQWQDMLNQFSEYQLIMLSQQLSQESRKRLLKFYLPQEIQRRILTQKAMDYIFSNSNKRLSYNQVNADIRMMVSNIFEQFQRLILRRQILNQAFQYHAQASLRLRMNEFMRNSLRQILLNCRRNANAIKNKRSPMILDNNRYNQKIVINSLDEFNSPKKSRQIRKNFTQPKLTGSLEKFIEQDFENQKEINNNRKRSESMRKIPYQPENHHRKVEESQRFHSETQGNANINKLIKTEMKKVRKQQRQISNTIKENLQYLFRQMSYIGKRKVLRDKVKIVCLEVQDLMKKQKK